MKTFLYILLIILLLPLIALAQGVRGTVADPNGTITDSAGQLASPPWPTASTPT